VYVLLGGEASPEDARWNGGVSFLWEEEEGGVLGRAELEDRELE